MNKSNTLSSTAEKSSKRNSKTVAGQAAQLLDRAADLVRKNGDRQKSTPAGKMTDAERELLCQPDNEWPHEILLDKSHRWQLEGENFSMYAHGGFEYSRLAADLRLEQLADGHAPAPYRAGQAYPDVLRLKNMNVELVAAIMRLDDLLGECPSEDWRTLLCVSIAGLIVEALRKHKERQARADRREARTA